MRAEALIRPSFLPPPFALLPMGPGRNARLERVATLIDWTPIDALVQQVRAGTKRRPP